MSETTNPTSSHEESVSAEASASPEFAPKPPSSRRLYQAGIVGCLGLLAYYTYTAKTASPVHLGCGLAMIVGAMYPSLMWAKRANFRFPVFEVFMLTGLNTYAIPLLSGHEQLASYSDDEITAAAFGVLLYQAVANFVFAVTRARPKSSRAWTEEVISNHLMDFLGYGMAITTVYTFVSLFTSWIPIELNSVARAGCFGVGIISTFIQSRMWGEGTLPRYRKGIFLVQLAVQVLLSWTSLTLIAGMSILILALLGYVSGGKKIPVLAIALVLPIISILHGGKSAMREKYWDGGAPPPTIAELPAYYSEWIDHAMNEAPGTQKKRESVKVLDRTSLFHILCLVVANSPSRQPFLYGETYTYVPGQFIPGPFWKDKPPAHVATNTLAVYYGLQTQEDTAKTTIAFGLVTEAYANFGYTGIGLLAATFAFAFKKFGELSANSPMLSYPGLVLIVLMAWSFQAELTMAAWIGSLYQACAVVLGIPFVVRNFIGQ